MEAFKNPYNYFYKYGNNPISYSMDFTQNNTNNNSNYNSRYNSPVSIISKSNSNSIDKLFSSNINNHQLKSMSDKREQERINLLNIINKQMMSNNRILGINNNNFNNINHVNEDYKKLSRKTINSFNINKINETPINSKSEKISTKRKSMIKGIPINEFSENLNDNLNKSNTTTSSTKELNTKIENLKSEMTLQMKNLEKTQKRLEKNKEIKEEINLIKSTFKNEINTKTNKTISEVRNLKQKFLNLQEDLYIQIKLENTLNNDQITSIEKEVTILKKEFKNRISDLENNQKKHIEGIKEIALTTKDKMTKQKANEILANENHQKKTQNKEFTEAMDKVQKFMMNKSGRMSIINDDNIKKLIEKTKLKNQNYEEDLNNDELNKKDKERNDINKRVSKFIDNDEKKEMGKINKLRKFVHMILAINRLKIFKNESNDNKVLNSLSYFTDEFYECDKFVKNFVNETIKVPFQSLINSKGLQIDLSNLKITKSSDDVDIKDSYLKLEVRLKSIFDELMNNTNKNNIPLKVFNFLKMIITNSTYVPFKFYSLFELTRCEISNNYLLSNLKEKHFAMILSFYFLIKILVKHIMCELNFLTLQRKGELNDNILKNLKMVASVIFYETIQLFGNHCPVINKIRNFEVFCKSQTYFVKKDQKLNKDDLTLKNNKKPTDKFYIEAVNKYNIKKKTKGEFNQSLLEQEKGILDKFNKRLIYATPDNNPNNVDYIQSSLYNFSDLNTYYILAKENKFDLTFVIFTWVKQLIKVLKE